MKSGSKKLTIARRTAQRTVHEDTPLQPIDVSLNLSAISHDESIHVTDFPDASITEDYGLGSPAHPFPIRMNQTSSPMNSTNKRTCVTKKLAVERKESASNRLSDSMGSIGKDHEFSSRSKDDLIAYSCKTQKQFLLTMGYAFAIDELLDPPPKWVAREIDKKHVENLCEAFVRNAFAHQSGRLWIVIVDASREQYEHDRTVLSRCKKYLIAGRHRKAALLKIRDENPAAFARIAVSGTIMCACYASGMSRSLILNLAISDNTVDIGSRQQTWLDKVLVARRLLLKECSSNEANMLTEELPLTLSRKIVLSWRESCYLVFASEQTSLDSVCNAAKLSVETFTLLLQLQKEIDKSNSRLTESGRKFKKRESSVSVSASYVGFPIQQLSDNKIAPLLKMAISKLKSNELPYTVIQEFRNKCQRIKTLENVKAAMAHFLDEDVETLEISYPEHASEETLLQIAEKAKFKFRSPATPLKTSSIAASMPKKWSDHFIAAHAWKEKLCEESGVVAAQELVYDVRLRDFNKEAARMDARLRGINGFSLSIFNFQADDPNYEDFDSSLRSLHNLNIALQSGFYVIIFCKLESTKRLRQVLEARGYSTELPYFAFFKDVAAGVSDVNLQAFLVANWNRANTPKIIPIPGSVGRVIELQTASFDTDFWKNILALFSPSPSFILCSCEKSSSLDKASTDLRRQIVWLKP